MGPRVPPEGSPPPPLEDWELGNLEDREPGARNLCRRPGLGPGAGFPEKPRGRQQTGCPLVGTSFSSPARWESSPTSLTCWDGVGFLPAEERRVLLLKPGSVFQGHVVERKLFWSHLPSLTFQAWLGAGACGCS